MWEEDLPRQLFWCIKYPLRGNGRPPEPHAPTWSWASLSNPNIEYDYARRNFVVDSAQILEAKCFVVGDNAFGHVIGGRLVLSAATIAVKGALWGHDAHQKLVVKFSSDIESEVYFDFDFRLDKINGYEGRNLWRRDIRCILLGHSHDIYQVDRARRPALLVISTRTTGVF